jgi:hypothetical protein
MSHERGNLASVASVEVIGVYPVPETPEPVHLVEIVVRNSPGFDPGDFVQPDPDRPESNWQTAYDERVLDDSGNSVITESFELMGDRPGRPELLQGDVRLVLFMHYLDPARPLRTPFGDGELPNASDRPNRLASIEYEQP